MFNESFWDRVKASILGYRYWIDEPGDDVMWFFSENHALLFHTNELLAGQLFGDELFSNSGESGEVHRQKAEQRLALWFERFLDEGLAEWNSSAYIPIDAVGLLHIYEFAHNEQLRQQAKRQWTCYSIILPFRCIKESCPQRLGAAMRRNCWAVMQREQLQCAGSLMALAM
ncbi:hypothetical protein Q0F98_32530 [Paenibacillus amylolyticus]|nr:hypothetical protein Q0F98_32530 [Paenibacillus amylolyticus]